MSKQNIRHIFHNTLFIQAVILPFKVVLDHAQLLYTLGQITISTNIRCMAASVEMTYLYNYYFRKSPHVAGDLNQASIHSLTRAGCL